MGILVNGVNGVGGASGGPALSDSVPAALGTASAGTSTQASRADHVHALPLAGALGTPTARWRASDLVLADGAAVASWPAIVGGASATAAQSDAAKRPVYRAAGTCGPGVAFDGANDVLDTTLVLPSGAAARALWCVLSDCVTTSGLRHALGYGAQSYRGAYHLMSGNSNAGGNPAGHYWSDNAAARSGYTSLARPSARVLVCAYDGAVDRVWCNGILVVEHAVALTTGAGVLRLGASTSGGEGVQGVVYEAGAIAGALSQTDALQLSRYLCDLYRVPYATIPAA